MLEFVNMNYNSVNKKSKEIIYKKSEEVEIKESLLKENREEDDNQLPFKQKYFSLKKKYDFMMRILFIIKELIGLFLFCIIYYYYYLSLEKCLRE